MSKIISKPRNINKIPQLFLQERSYFKFFWIFFIIGLLPCSAWFIIQNLNSYLTYSYIKTQATLNQNYNTIRFPAVTICGGISANNLIKCSFNNLECNVSNLTYIFEYSIWNTSCFTLSRTANPVPVELRKLQIRAGFKSGLELEFLSEKNIEQIDESYMSIHDSSTRPGLLTLKLRISYKLKWQYVNKYMLELRSEKRLGEPYTKCIHGLVSENSHSSSLAR